jgi:hypothetical protein
MLTPLFVFAFTVTCHCCSFAFAVAMGSSLTSSGTNYRDWVPRIHLHICGLRLWDFLTEELPCSPRPSAPIEPVIKEKTTTIKKEKFLADYEDRMTSYESQFHAYMTWLNEDAHAVSVLIASMEDYFVVDIVEFEQTHQMWSYIC